MKFLVDMALSPGLAQWLTSQGHEAVHASAIGLASAPDTAIISRAKLEDSIVVTADLDYPRLLALSGAHSPAVILFSGRQLERGSSCRSPDSRFESDLRSRTDAVTGRCREIPYPPSHAPDLN